MSKSQLCNAYEHIQCGFNDGIPQIFIKKWVSFNDNIRKYDDIDIYPDETKCPSNILNVWRPFEMELKTEPYIEKPDVLKIMLNHIHILCDNDRNVSDYFIKWIAQMIQYPAVKILS